jgi:hypothetical protein
MCTIPLMIRRSSTRCAPRRPRGISGAIRAHSASESQYSALPIQASAVWKLESQIGAAENLEASVRSRDEEMAIGRGATSLKPD